jgi:RNA polymerase sporulation-specific sigma factor
MQKFIMNDYELIYLYQTYRDEYAYTFMHKKYHKFIWKIIHTLHTDSIEHDDLYQESLMTLFKAMNTFSEVFSKTFTRYFELILKRHLYHVIHKTPKFVITEEQFFESIIVEEVQVIEETTFTFENANERHIYDLYFVKGMRVKDIAIKESLSSKQVYNLIYRVKDKIRYMVKKSSLS